MLRPARDTDLETLRQWRNQDANQQVSVHQDPVGAEEHAAWWAAVRDDPRRQVLVLEVDGRACGVVTFFNLRSDAGLRRGAWGFHLDHDGLAAQGSTLVAWQLAVREGLDHAFDVLGLDVLEAEVLEHNEVVRRSNRRAGFVELPVEERVVEHAGAPVVRRVVPVELRREDRRVRGRAATPADRAGRTVEVGA